MENTLLKQLRYSAAGFFICLFMCSSLFSQQQFTWYETSSPVTTRLNGIDAFGSGYLNQFWFCGNNGVVFKTTNNGSSYMNRTGNGIPVNVDLITIAIFDTNVVVTAGVRNDTAFVYKSSNSGLNWQVTFVQPGGYINAICERQTSPFQYLKGFMAGNPVGGRWSLWKTSNAGLTWDSTGEYLPQAGSETSFPGSLVFIDSLIMFGTNNSRIYRSTNVGNTWNAQVVAGEQEPSAFDFGPYYGWPGLPYGDVGGLTTIQSTTNNGLNWNNNPYSLLGTGRILSLEGHPGGVFDYSFMDNWYVRNDNKIYHSGFGSWQVHYTASSGNYTYMSQGEQTSIYIAAVRDNGGITFCNCQIWGAVRNLGGSVPDNYSLSQNYPNPFNPKTVIRFQVASDRFVTLKIFDVLGKEVAALVGQQLNPGTYQADWDGTNYPSGVYFYQLSIGNELLATNKMVLIK